MAELLVRLFDKYTGSDLHMKSKTTHRGDVIVVNEDGWPWSDYERTSPNWIIIKVALPIAKAVAMLTPELGDHVAKPFLQLRRAKLNLDFLNSTGHRIPTEAEARKGNPRPDPSITITEAEFDAARLVKPEIADPFIIG